MTDEVTTDELTPMPIVALDLPSARDLAGRVGVYQDLVRVAGFCNKLLQLMDSADDEPDPLLGEALWSTAIITYSRCFTGGKREYRPQPDDIAALPLEGDVLEFHNLILNLRDKHIAHSVNAFEEVLIGAVLSPLDSSERKVEGITTLARRLIMHDQQGVWQLGNLARLMAAAMAAKLDEQTGVVLAEAQTLDVDGLYSQPTLKSYIPGSEDAAKARS